MLALLQTLERRVQLQNGTFDTRQIKLSDNAERLGGLGMNKRYTKARIESGIRVYVTLRGTKIASGGAST